MALFGPSDKELKATAKKEYDKAIADFMGKETTEYQQEGRTRVKKTLNTPQKDADCAEDTRSRDQIIINFLKSVLDISESRAER